MTVSDQIISVINILCEKFGIVIDWASENVGVYISDLIGRIAQYEIWTSVAWIGIMLLASIICLLITRWVWKLSEDRYDLEIVAISAVIITCVVLLSTIGVIIAQVFDIIQAIHLPEMTAIEYVKNLLETQVSS